MLSIQQIRQTLGHKADRLTDDQVRDIEQRLRILANVVIDRVMDLSKKESGGLSSKAVKRTGT
jgi:hypothetical protein